MISPEKEREICLEAVIIGLVPRLSLPSLGLLDVYLFELAFQPQLIIEDLSGKNLWAHGCHLPSPTSGSGTSITISPLAGTCLCLRLWAMIKTAAWLIGFLPPFRGNRLFPCCQQEIVGENHQPGPSTMTVPSGPRKNNPDGRSCWGNAES